MIQCCREWTLRNVPNEKPDFCFQKARYESEKGEFARKRAIKVTARRMIRFLHRSGIGMIAAGQAEQTRHTGHDYSCNAKNGFS